MDARTLVTTLGFTLSDQTQSNFEKINHNIEQVRHRLELIAGVEILKGLYELAERFGGMGEQLESASIAAGLTVEQFQALSYAAAQNGVSQDEMSTGLARLSKALYNAKKGSKEATEAFGAAGIGPDQVRTFHNSTDAFLALGDALQRMEDPAAKVAVLQELMGRGSFKLLKFAQQGRENIKGLQKEAQDIGAVLSGGFVEDLAKSEQSVLGFKTVIRAVVAELGARFAPNVIAVTHALEKFWLRNRSIIMSKLEGWFYDLGFAIGATYAAIEILANGVADFVKNHPAMVAFLGSTAKYLIAMSVAGEAVGFMVTKAATAFVALKGVLGLFLTPWRAALYVAGALQAALSAVALRLALLTATSFPALSEVLLTFGAAISALPVTLVAAGLVALASAAYTMWEMFEGKSLSETAMGRSLSWLLSVLVQIKDVAGSFASRLFASLGNNMGGGGAGSAFVDRGVHFRLPETMAATSAMQASASTPMYSMPTSPFASGGSATGGVGGMSMANNMPVTINVNGAQQPQAIASQISKALSDHQDDLNRRSMSHIQTALVH
jgi:hypothetical protein